MWKRLKALFNLSTPAIGLLVMVIIICGIFIMGYEVTTRWANKGQDKDKEPPLTVIPPQYQSVCFDRDEDGKCEAVLCLDLDDTGACK